MTSSIDVIVPWWGRLDEKLPKHVVGMRHSHKRGKPCLGPLWCCGEIKHHEERNWIGTRYVAARRYICIKHAWKHGLNRGKSTVAQDPTILYSAYEESYESERDRKF